MTHRVTLTWAGGAHAFALDLGGLRAVQEACNAGPQRVMNRLLSGDMLVDDPLVICRHGLIGAGMDEVDAQRRVLNAVHSGGWQNICMTAALVLGAALTGVADDPLDSTEGGDAEKPTGVMTASGGSAGFTAAEPAPGSPPKTSTR